MVPGFKMLVDKYDAGTLESVWQSIFKMYNNVLGALGGDAFAVGHSGITTSQKPGLL